AFASALPMVMIGSLAAPLTWAIARDLGSTRTVRVGAAVLAAIPAAGTVFMAQPENFAIFQPLVAAALWLAARGMRGDGRSFALSGLLVGLASITRNDAFLLGGAIGLVFLIERARAWRGGRPARLSIAAAAGCVGLYLLVVAPWWARQLVEFGSISPTASSGTALWLTEYRQWNSITADLSLQAFLDQGPGVIIATRLVGLTAALANFVVVISSVILVPLIVIGAVARRRSDEFLPWFLYAGILLLGATFLFPLHVPGGAFVHSAVGLGPHAYILALEAVGLVIAAIGRRRPRWDAAVATPIFSWAIVGLVVGSAFIYGPIVHGHWDETRAPRQALAATIDGLGVGPTDRIMSTDAGGIKYWTDRPGVVSPDDDIDTIEAVARGYDIRWLLLERGAVVEALVPVLTDDRRPTWIGPAAFSVPSPSGGPAALALFPVCLSTADPRCGGGA
ncbi:MAG: glycosyltransferase family 39 protein, partial [Candidatus Limnocylindrales bacterium]